MNELENNNDNVIDDPLPDYDYDYGKCGDSDPQCFDCTFD